MHKIIQIIYLFVDGLVESNSIIEIKCPYTAKDTVDAVSAVNNKLVSYTSLFFIIPKNSQMSYLYSCSIVL